MKNIIFFGSDDDVINQMYKDLETNENVLYKKGIINLKNKFLKLIFSITFSKKINQFLKIPFKKNWFKYSLEKEINISKKPIFIFTKDNLKYLEFGFANYLKKLYPKCKIVLLFLDIHGLRGYDFNTLNGLYDYAYTFDELEAKKYSINYYPLCYSHSEYEDIEKKYDICFIGQDKGRIDKIYSLFLNAKKCGLKTKIIICGKCDKKSKYPEFEYVDHISYNDALKFISQSKYNVEICLQDTTSISIRLYEAIMFNQGLITNNSYISKSPYYDDSFVHIIDFDNINLDFINGYKKKENSILKEKISPLGFIKCLED